MAVHDLLSCRTSIHGVWNWRNKNGYAHAVNVKSETLEDVQRELGMAEGFDVGLEMSGNPSAFRAMLKNMAQGGKIAMLGIPSEDISINWNVVVFNMLTIHGIYGREMYETWYKITVILQSGLDISLVITHCPALHRIRTGLRGDEFRTIRESHPEAVGESWRYTVRGQS